MMAETRTYTHTGIDIHGETITKTVTITHRELTAAEAADCAERTRRDCAALCSYALNNPEVPIH